MAKAAAAAAEGSAMCVVRVADPSDVAALSELGRRTFVETFVEDFAIGYPPDDLTAFLETSYGGPAIAVLLADPQYRHWIAEVDGVAVGYALAGPSQLPHSEVAYGDGELKRLYVARGAQKSGVGRALFGAAISWMTCDQPSSRPLWIGVWSGNLRAQRFYERNGFVKVGEYSFAVGRAADHEYIMRRCG